MAYRFAIIPAGVAASAAVADELVAEMRTQPNGRPPDAIADVLGALKGSAAGDFTVGRATDSRGVFLTAPHPECGLLEALLLLTKDRFQAVYDRKLHRLYDPTNRVDVDVCLPGIRLPYLTRDLLGDLVRHPQWPELEAPYLTVDRAEQDFIQAWRHPDGVYQLEYREGGPESHFEARSSDPQAVADLLWWWCTGDPAWRTAVDWLFMELESDPEPIEAGPVPLR